MELSDEQNAFLQKHSNQFLKMAFDYKRHEKVYQPDGYGKNTGDCGDTVEISLTTKKKIIQHVSLGIEGCINTNACANAVAHFAEGRSVDEAWDITPEKIIDFLETLDEDSHHCAELAVGSLYLALSDFKKKPVTRQ
ncbi:MAG: iron-sulfur cluster assembly scaffold protein [Proteobacteria bacterium]|nr:iron-sulfur cluster assembly scaffold protein [Pseudomonadota bacterium]